MSAAKHGFGKWTSECPPCSGDCQQGRECPAQEACTQDTRDDEREAKRRDNEVLSAETWALIDALVAIIFVGVVAGIALEWLA